MNEVLDSPAIESRLSELPAWHREGDTIFCQRVLKNFAESLDFVQRVGALAEAADHHPDIDIRWNKVRLVLSTHSKGGLTELDFSLAAQIEALD
jgi:4a-hydroxytetrahydrobiopterin dehydratase